MPVCDELVHLAVRSVLGLDVSLLLQEKNILRAHENLTMVGYLGCHRHRQCCSSPGGCVQILCCCPGCCGGRCRNVTQDRQRSVEDDEIPCEV